MKVSANETIFHRVVNQSKGRETWVPKINCNRSSLRGKIISCCNLVDTIILLYAQKDEKNIKHIKNVEQ